MNALCVCEKGPSPSVVHEHEEEIARRWWALPLNVSLPLSNGDSCQLLYAGRPGGSLGPDVRDAVLRFTSHRATTTLADLSSRHALNTAGDVEIHVRASDWFAHQHHTDARYNNVMLHVVLICDDSRPTLRQDGTAIPTCSLYDLPHTTNHPAQWPCQHIMARMNEEQRARLLTLAGSMRFEQKARALLAALRDAQPSGLFSACDVCLIPALAEGLGYGRDRAFFRAAGLHLVGVAQGFPEPLGRAPEPSPLDASRLHILHNLVEQWRATGAWNTFRRTLLSTSQNNVHPTPAPAFPDTFWPMREGVSPGRPQGSPLPVPTTPALTKTRSDESNMVIVRAGEADDVGRGPLRSPSFQKVPGRETPAPTKSPSAPTAISALRNIFSGLSKARADILICNIVLPFAAAVAQQEKDAMLAEQARNLFIAYHGLPSNQITRAMCKQLLLQSEPKGACQQQGLHFIYAQTCREKRCNDCMLGKQDI